MPWKIIQQEEEEDECWRGWIAVLDKMVRGGLNEETSG